jgi:hypothetical protein
VRPPLVAGEGRKETSDVVRTEESDARRTRGARNESEARERNEQIRQSHEGSTFIEFTCECAQKTCEAVISLSLEEYEDVRKEPTRFVVARGHVAAGLEVVVREARRYQVVERRGTAAAMPASRDRRRSSSVREDDLG